jgi:hypothetical protein
MLMNSPFLLWRKFPALGYRYLILFAGFAVAGSALLAPNVGLGRGPDFILYHPLGISRSDLLFIGLLVCVASVLNKKSYSATRTQLKRTEIHRHLAESAKTDVARQWSDLRLLAIELVVASVIAIPMFWLNRRNLLGYIDGQYLLTLIDNQRQFGVHLPQFSTNPLQGLGDVWYFTNPNWIPEFLLARMFDAPTARAVALQTVAFLDIFLAVSLLSYWLNGSIRRAVMSGWLAGLIMFPFAYPSLIYNVLPDAPQIASLVVVPIAIVPLLFSIGRRSSLCDAAATCTIVVLMWIQFVALSLFVVLTLPFLLFLGVALLIHSVGDRSLLRKRAIWCTVIMVALAASGLPLIVLGFVTDTAFQFFPADLTRDLHPLSDGSILLRTNEPVGMLVAAGGLVGAVYCAVFGMDRTRFLGQAICGLVTSILAASVVYSVIGFRGAKPIYYEYVLWPIYPIFLIAALDGLWACLRMHLGSPVERLGPVMREAAWAWMPLVALIVLHGYNFLSGFDDGRPNIYPPKPSAISEFLRSSVGLLPGRDFNGRVVTITGVDGTTWDDAFRYDLNLIKAVGNDHRTIGMWFYNIPTLIEFSHAIRPLLFAVTKAHLAREHDGQQLNILNFREANIGILRLLGVRYLVTDRPIPAEGTKRIIVMPVPGASSSLALDELPSPNVGVSPTKIAAEDGKEALRMLSDINFNFETTAIVSREIRIPLVPATDIHLVVERGGLRIEATSAGDSLIIIPFQYSHCLRAISRSSGRELPLIRSDFLLTGLLFNGKLDADIEYRQGPFFGTQCGLYDVHEDRQALGSGRSVE